MKNVSTDIYEKALRKLTFPDYKSFRCINEAFPDLTSKMFEVINKVAPAKAIRVMNNTNECFDREIAEKLFT